MVSTFSEAFFCERFFVILSDDILVEMFHLLNSSDFLFYRIIIYQKSSKTKIDSQAANIALAGREQQSLYNMN